MKSHGDPEDVFATYDAEALAADFLIPKHMLRYDKYEEFLEERARLIRAKVVQYLADSQEHNGGE